MNTHERRARLSSLVAALAAALWSGSAATDEPAVERARTRVAVEIDLEPIKIDVAAEVRAIDSSLKRAKVQPADPDEAKLAAADARTRG